MISRDNQGVDLSFEPARAEDLEALNALRSEAMRESLERIGRFDPERSRARFRAAFMPEATRHILLEGQRVGFVAVNEERDMLILDHLYVHPSQQGRGIGSAVLAGIFQEADAKALPVRVGALRGSESNRFYLRHGFIFAEESEWDIYYVRPPRAADVPCTRG